MTKTLNLTPGRFGDLTVLDNNRITRLGNTLFAVAGNIAMLDVKARNSTNLDTHLFLDFLSREIEKTDLKLQYVKNVKEFFNPAARWQDFLNTGNVDGIVLSEEEKAVAKQFKDLRARFETTFKLPTVPYIPMAVPDKGVVKFKLSKSGKQVSRSGYSVGLATVKRLWGKAAAKWAVGKTGVIKNDNTTIGGYYRGVTVNEKSVTVGCQVIPRWEIEQFAKSQGWDFPEAEAI